MRELSWAEIFNRIMLPSFGMTMYMLALGVMLAGSFGFLLAILLYVTGKNGLHPNKKIYGFLNLLISTIRAFPFVILIVAIIPITRFLVGTIIGAKAALVPMTIAATPFMARIFENALKEVKPGLVDAARSFGATDMQIIFKVILPETLPAMVTGFTMSVISVLNMTTTAGTLGGGGLGASALSYGYQNFNDKIMYSIVAVMVALVMVIQFIGDLIYKKIK